MIPGPPTNTRHPWGGEETPYLQIGSEEGVRFLVEAFYDVIEERSPGLRAMLPANTTGSRQKLFEYLTGWMGGPPLYAEKRGHPRLRMRHAPFPIGQAEAEEWMRCMRTAFDRAGVEGELRAFLDEKLAPLADHMINK